MMRSTTRALWAASLIAIAAAGCAAPNPTTDVLVVTSRAPDAADYFDLHLFAWERGALMPRWARRIGPAAAPPKALALDQDGVAMTVELRDRADGLARLRRVAGVPGGQPDAAPSTDASGALMPEVTEFDGVRFDVLLDANRSTLLLARQIQRPARPVLRVSRGEIREVQPAWSQLFVVDLTTRTAQADVVPPVVPLARLSPLEWLVLAQGPPRALQILDARSGTLTQIADWDAKAHIAGAIVTPGGGHALLAVQRVGERWNMFDIVRWSRATNRVEPLIADVFSANRPNANVSPALPLYAINDRHFAFVLTEVTEWRGKLPLEGAYHTAVADIQTGNVLVRIRNPQRSLRNEVPPPYLPGGRLTSLRIERTNPAAPGGGFDEESDAGDERWQPFLAFRNQRLVDPGGAAHDPRTLGPYAYSSEGAALAVRQRSGEADRCLVMTRGRLHPAIELRRIERLAWLAVPHAKSGP